MTTPSDGSDDRPASGEPAPPAWDAPPQPPAWDRPGEGSGGAPGGPATPGPAYGGYGQPGYAQPSSGQPGYGQPSYSGQPGYGQPTYSGQPGYGGPPAYAAPGWGPPPAYGGGYGYAPPQNDTKAVVALVLAIGSWVVCPIVPAVVALVLASSSQREIDASGGRLGGTGLNKASKIVSWLNIGLWGIGIVLVVVFLVAVGASSTSP